MRLRYPPIMYSWHLTEVAIDLEKLKRIASTVDAIRGWDFSRVRTRRDPTPWDYSEVVKRYLRPSDHVLDIATAGGEIFLALAPHFGSGLGVDISEKMIETARENVSPHLKDIVSFEVMAAQDLNVECDAYDTVLNRHGPVFVQPIVNALRPGGYFLCQQVGELNTQNVIQMFGWESGGAYWRHYCDEHELAHQDPETLAQSFSQMGCRVVASGSYNVPYTFLDLESFIFHLKAVPLPEEFDMDRHADRLVRFIEENTTVDGIETNEHRDLLIVQKLR